MSYDKAVFAAAIRLAEAGNVRVKSAQNYSIITHYSTPPVHTCKVVK